MFEVVGVADDSGFQFEVEHDPMLVEQRLALIEDSALALSADSDVDEVLLEDQGLILIRASDLQADELLERLEIWWRQHDLGESIR